MITIYSAALAYFGQLLVNYYIETYAKPNKSVLLRVRVNYVVARVLDDI